MTIAEISRQNERNENIQKIEVIGFKRSVVEN
jgi:hypothetical protein